MTSTIIDHEPLFQDAAQALEVGGALGLLSARLAAVSTLFKKELYLKAASSFGTLAPGITYGIQYTMPRQTEDKIIIDLTSPFGTRVDEPSELLYEITGGSVMDQEAIDEELALMERVERLIAEEEREKRLEELREQMLEEESSLSQRESVDYSEIASMTDESLFIADTWDEDRDKYIEIITREVVPEQDLNHLQAMLNEARGQEAIWNMPYAENLAFRNEQQILDMVGMYGYLEADRQGALAAAAEAGVLIPWETSGDDLVCEDCEELEAMGPYPPDEYPEPPHFGCRCMPGDPVLPEGGEEPPGPEGQPEYDLEEIKQKVMDFETLTPGEQSFFDRAMETPVSERGTGLAPRYLEDYVERAGLEVPYAENPLEMVQMAQVYEERWALLEPDAWKMDIFQNAGADLHDAAFNLAVEWERIGKLIEAGETISAEDKAIWELRGMVIEPADITSAAERLGLGVVEETVPEEAAIILEKIEEINAAIDVPEGENALEIVKVAQFYQNEWAGEEMNVMERFIFDNASGRVHSLAYDLAEQFEELAGYSYSQLSADEQAILDLADMAISREELNLSLGVLEPEGLNVSEYTVEDLGNILKKVDDPRAFLNTDEAAIFHNASESEIQAAREWMKSEIEALSQSNRSTDELNFIKSLSDSGMNRPILVEDNEGQLWIVKTGTVEEAKNEIVGAEIAEQLGLGGPGEILTEDLTWFQDNFSDLADKLMVEREDKNVVIFSKHVGTEAEWTLAEYQVYNNINTIIDVFWEFEDDALTSIVKDVLTLNTDGHFNNYLTDGSRLFTIDNSLADNNVSVYTKTANGTPIVRSHFGEAMIQNSVDNGELLGSNGMTASDYVDYYFRDLIDKAQDIDVSSLPESRQAYIQDRIGNLEKLLVNEVDYWAKGGSWMNPATH